MISTASNTATAISLVLFWVENLPCDKQSRVYHEQKIKNYGVHFSIIVPTAVHKEAEFFSHENLKQEVPIQVHFTKPWQVQNEY